MMQPPVQWVAPAPMWTDAMNDRTRMQSPAVLRFRSDAFMEDLTDLLDREPEQLGGVKATPESFRAPPLGAPRDWTPPAGRLKLYQPTHGHFNLIAASLVCRLTGLPDRTLNIPAGEKVSFVLRRIAATGEEMAWIDRPGQARGWQLLSPAQYRALAEFEQLLPMFPLSFSLSKQRRRLFAGLIPVASRETFQAGPSLSPFTTEKDPVTGADKDPRIDDIQTRAVDRLADLQTSPDDQLPPPPRAVIDAKRLQEQEASRFILLDLAEFVASNLPTVWAAIGGGEVPAISQPDRVLYDLLTASITDTNDPRETRWSDALALAWNERAAITGEPGAPAPTLQFNLRFSSLASDTLSTRLAQALDSPSAAPLVPAVPPQVPRLEPGAGIMYVARCVFQRPQCGPLQPEVVSLPTDTFELASFFDFDAPTRPIRISMPIDTSVSGLRKFNKNVAFVLSDQLQQQIARAADLNKLLKGEFASGEQINIGFICSFSMPIITICALIVLMIFLNLLNIIFWWLPFLKICFPIITPRKA